MVEDALFNPRWLPTATGIVGVTDTDVLIRPGPLSTDEERQKAAARRRADAIRLIVERAMAAGFATDGPGGGPVAEARSVENETAKVGRTADEEGCRDHARPASRLPLMVRPARGCPEEDTLREVLIDRTAPSLRIVRIDQRAEYVRKGIQGSVAGRARPVRGWR